MPIYKNLSITTISNLLSRIHSFLYFCIMQSNQEKLVAHFLEQLNLNNTAISQESYDKLIAQKSQLITIADVLTYVKAIGSEIHQEDLALELVEKIENETDIIMHKLKFIAAADRPSVLVLNQIQPLEINQDAFVEQSITIAGGIPTAVPQEADKIIILPHDESIFTDIPTLLNHSEVARSKAIELDQLFVMTKPNFASIPGYDYLAELEALAEILQPKYFVYGHEGTSWLQFQLK